MKKLAALCLLLLAGPLWGQEVTLELKGDIEKSFVEKVVIVKEPILLAKSLPFSIHAPQGGFGYVWDYPANVEVVRRGAELRVIKAPKGNLTVSVEFSVVDFKAMKVDTKFGSIDFAVGEVKPPEPPKPPIPGADFRVMVIYESSQAMPSAQQVILTSPTVRTYLNSKTVPTPDGGKRGYYITDKDADFSNESKIWRDTLARPRMSIPWVVITSSTGGFEGPLPANIAEFMTLLSKFGG